jgi:hypothetical protein
VAIVLSSVTSPALAADVELATGLTPKPAPVERPIDFGGVGDDTPAPGSGPHPRRFPTGVCGRAYLAVSGSMSRAWKKVVLRCPGMREAQPFPRTGWLRFEHLRAGETCELRLRGDGRAKVTVTIAP